jgi:hypothetical protein
MGKRFALLGAIGAAAVILSLLMPSQAGWEDSALKGLLVPPARFLLDLFNSPATAIIFAGALVLGGGAMALSFRLGRVRPILREIGELSEVVASSRSIAARDERLARLADVFDRSSLLRREFRLYAAALRAAKPGATPRAGHYIDMGAVERSGCGVTAFGQMGGHVMAIGLALTFCGLVAGLYFAGKGLVASDLATARASLVQLLQAATFKFLTSIAGIGTSVGMSLVHQRSAGALAGALDDLTLSLDEALGMAD